MEIMNTNNDSKVVGVIGAGPAGYAATIVALKMGYRVEVIDPWIFASSRVPSEEDSGLKARFGSIEMHQYPAKYLKGFGSQIVPASGVVGGYTTIWGAGLDFDTDSFLRDYTTDLITEAKKIVREIFHDFEGPHYVSKRFKKLLENPNNGFRMSQLAVKESRCTLTGECMKGCKKEAIWSAEEQWEKIVENKVTLRKGFARLISEDKSKVRVVIDCDTQEYHQEYDLLLVACGAVASASLGQRSGYFPRLIEIGETSISYLPLLIAKGFKPFLETNFTLSQIFYHKKTPKEDQNVWLSLFEASEFLRQQATIKLGRFARLVPKFIWGYIGVAINYTPENFSNKILLKHQDNISIVTNKKNSKSDKIYLKKLFNYTKKDFFLNGLLFHPKVRLRSKPAGSYHLGHLTKNGTDLLDVRGRSFPESRIAFVDSLSLPKLPSGPITAIAMMNACLKTELHLS
jgi:hypothetical protein